MISERKLAANRRNASRSSGPRTLRGKSRSSRNALRHGLAVPLSNDPARLFEIEQLAKILSASSNDLLCQDEARELAECHFDLRKSGLPRLQFCYTLEALRIRTSKLTLRLPRRSTRSLGMKAACLLVAGSFLRPRISRTKDKIEDRNGVQYAENVSANRVPIVSRCWLS